MAICKFNIGDMVERINYANGDAITTFRVGQVGKVVEICSDGFLDIEVNGKLNTGNDPRNLKLVKAAPKFKVGDKVIGNNPDRYLYTKKGWKGVVKDVNSYGNISVMGQGNPSHNQMFHGLEPQYFDLVKTEEKTEEKIVITHDGKTTTATKYCEDGSKVTATARCAPEDDFDFRVGAEIAMGRLVDKLVFAKHNIIRVVFREGEQAYSYKTRMNTAKVGMKIVVPVGKSRKEVTATVVEIIPGAKYNGEYAMSAMTEIDIVEKVSTVEVAGFKVGDRVNYNGHNGTIICIQDLCRGTATPVGVEFDTWHGAWHNCDGFRLADGKHGTTGRCKWCEPEQLKHIELSKYYNGKVVCVESERDYFTVGKIYTFKNGTIRDDDGDLHYDCNPIKDLSQIVRLWKFIPVVENKNDPLTIEDLQKMDGQKVYVIHIGSDGKEDPGHSFCGWHTVDVKKNWLIDKDGWHYEIKSNNEAHGYHAYRQEPSK